MVAVTVVPLDVCHAIIQLSVWYPIHQTLLHPTELLLQTVLLPTMEIQDIANLVIQLVLNAQDHLFHNVHNALLDIT